MRRMLPGDTRRRLLQLLLWLYVPAAVVAAGSPAACHICVPLYKRGPSCRRCAASAIQAISFLFPVGRSVGSRVAGWLPSFVTRLRAPNCLQSSGNGVWVHTAHAHTTRTTLLPSLDVKCLCRGIEHGIYVAVERLVVRS